MREQDQVPARARRLPGAKGARVFARFAQSLEEAGPLCTLRGPEHCNVHLVVVLILYARVMIYAGVFVARRCWSGL